MEKINTKTIAPVVIIGNGISGVTTARHLRKQSDVPIIIISSESSYFFSRTALMYVYMGHMKFEHTQPYENSFWKKNKITLLQKHVAKVVPNDKKIVFSDKKTLFYDKLVLAVGSVPNKFGWEGQDLDAVQGLYFKQDLENLEKWSPTIKRAVIVGGGLIGIELAEMLHSRNIATSFLVRESSFWDTVLPKEESEMINQHILANGIDLRLNTNLKSIKGDGLGRAKEVHTDRGDVIPCQFVGLTTGVRPNIDFLKNSGIDLKNGILVNRFLETNCKDIYAIGDCAEQIEAIGQRRSIEAVWYTGRMMGETLAKTLTGNRTEYNPSQIEYQTYGWVFANKNQDVSHFFWKHPSKNILVRMAYNKQNKLFLGINTFGIRMRHEYFEKWLNEKKNINFVIENLKKAIFDPEFFTHYEKNIIALWKQQN